MNLQHSVSTSVVMCEGYGDFRAAMDGPGLDMRNVMCLLIQDCHFELFFPTNDVTLGCDSLVADAMRQELHPGHFSKFHLCRAGAW